MQSEHRKIELQSPSDLTYLTSQIRAAALQKLDLHLPAQPTDSADDLRAQTETLINAFITSILTGLKQNITINGLDVVETRRGGDLREEGEEKGDAMDGVQVAGVAGVESEEFEVFDEKLRSRLGEAVARRDKLVSGISRHRRETGLLAARRFEERFEREGEMERRMLEGVGERGEAEQGLQVQVKREEEVRRNWERAVEGLGRLNKGLPETRARLERCGDVVGYLEGGKK